MKHLAALLLATALGGCAVVPTAPEAPGDEVAQEENALPAPATLAERTPEVLALPASFSIPLEIRLNAAQLRSHIAKKDGRSVHYFSEENAAGEYPKAADAEQAKYSRIILGRTEKGECVVQSFFAATGRKHTEPLATSAGDCERFSGDTSPYKRWFRYGAEGDFAHIVLRDMMSGLVVHNYEYQAAGEGGASVQTLTRIDFSHPTRIVHLRQTRAVQLSPEGASTYAEDGAITSDMLETDSADGTELFTHTVHGQEATTTAFTKGAFQYQERASAEATTRRLPAEVEDDAAFAAELQTIRDAIAAAQAEIEFFKGDQPLR